MMFVSLLFAAADVGTGYAEDKIVLPAASDAGPDKNAPVAGGKKILIAFFSHSGNTREIAGQIHEITGGDTFEIKAVRPYPKDYDAVVEQAKKELEANLRPQLAEKLKGAESYDVIFVGYPNWWGTMPMAVFTFLTENGFAGKTIVPFCTHEGSALGASVSDIGKLCPKSTIVEGLAVYGSEVKKARGDVAEWLSRIGMSKR
jgi:flavodoxin